MSKKSEKGNVIELVVIGVLLLAVIGLVVWRVIDNNKKSDANTQTTQTSQTETTTSNESTTNSDSQPKTTQQTDPNKDYIVLDDWGVRFKPSGGMQFSYAKTAEGNYGFSTSVLEGLGKYCYASEGGRGALLRSESKDPSGGTMLGLALNNEQPINGFYYYMQGPQSAGCGDYEPTQQQVDIETKQAALIKSLLLTIEAKQ